MDNLDRYDVVCKIKQGGDPLTLHMKMGYAGTGTVNTFLVNKETKELRDVYTGKGELLPDTGIPLPIDSTAVVKWRLASMVRVYPLTGKNQIAVFFTIFQGNRKVQEFVVERGNSAPFYTFAHEIRFEKEEEVKK